MYATRAIIHVLLPYFCDMPYLNEESFCFALPHEQHVQLQEPGKKYSRLSWSIIFDSTGLAPEDVINNDTIASSESSEL